MQSRAAQQGVTVELEGHTTGGPLAFHASTLRRAVLNVVQNAIEAMPEGVRCAWSVSAAPRRCSCASAIAGWACPPSKCRGFSSPCFTTKPGGTGLGLYIVREILVAHGGGVAVESVEGQGTTFILMFPIPG